jgi:hypothetical protein
VVEQVAGQMLMGLSRVSVHFLEKFCVMRLFVWRLVLVWITVWIGACAAPGKPQPVAEQNAAQLRIGLTQKHPSAYLYLARALWQEGKKDEAVIFYYVGQIRYRAYINTLPAPEDVPEVKLYENLKSEIGDEVNEYAARDLDNWLSLIDGALQWHREKPCEFLPKDDYSLLYELMIYNFDKLREYVANNKDLIRKQRAEQELVNEF